MEITPEQAIDSWAAYQKLILFRLDEHGSQLNAMDTKLDALTKAIHDQETSVSLLNLKVGFIGSVAAVVTSFLYKVFVG